MVVAIAVADGDGIMVAPVGDGITVAVGAKEGRAEATAEPTAERAAETPGTWLAALHPESTAAQSIKQIARTVSICFLIS